MHARVLVVSFGHESARMVGYLTNGHLCVESHPQPRSCCLYGTQYPQLLQVVPSERMTAAQASEHTWLGGASVAASTRKAADAEVERNLLDRLEDSRERLRQLRQDGNGL